MQLTIAVDMDYTVVPGDPALLAVAVAENPRQAVIEDDLTVDAATLQWLEDETGHGPRVWAFPSGDRLRLAYRCTVAIDRPDPPLADLPADPMHRMPSHVLQYLRSSAFSPAERFAVFVNGRFGALSGGAKVAAMRDWVAEELAYVPGSSGPDTTALDTFVARQGVCRDYAHLMCSLARAAGIPARYAAGYSPGVTPPDFHACAEVWLDGGWHLVDPTGMSTPSSFARIGAGRDAADMAFMETTGWASVVWQEVRVGVG